MKKVIFFLKKNLNEGSVIMWTALVYTYKYDFAKHGLIDWLTVQYFKRAFALFGTLIE